MAKRYYKPELDALRFFAFACVFCDHLSAHTLWKKYIVDSGEFGMCIFFMLSSYLIVTILLREEAETGTISWKAFAIRRVLRIWPLYFLVLFLIFFLGHYWPAVRISLHTVIAFSVLMGNVLILRHGWFVGPIGPLWSLSVEEQFYVALPLVFLLGGKRGLTGICVTTIVLAYGVLFWLGHRGAIPVVGVWANSFVQFQFFAAGGLLAIGFHHRRISLPLLPRIAMAAVGLVLWLLASVDFHLRSFVPATARQLVCGYIIVLLGTVLIFLSVLDLDRPIPQVLIYLGKISYGLYLFHDLAIFLILHPHSRWLPSHFIQEHQLAAAALTLGLTIAISALSYHFFERPILKYKEHFETVRTRPA